MEFSLLRQLSMKFSILRQTFYGIQHFISMESQPQNPEFRNNPENFHP